MKSILGKFGTNILTGKNAFNISLPVNILGNQSMLQKMASDCRVIPNMVNHFIQVTNNYKNKGEQPDHIEQIYIITT